MEFNKNVSVCACVHMFEREIVMEEEIEGERGRECERERKRG